MDVVVVGAGPAGSAAALQLARLGLARRTLLLDAAVFPREKLCGGGVVRSTDRFLAHLGGPVEVPGVSIDVLRGEYAGGCLEERAPGLFRVVHRAAFDAALLARVRQAGVEVREGQPVSRVTGEAGGLRLVTPRGPLEARVVIGADGAHSRIRRALVGPTAGDRIVALEALTPGWPPGGERTAVFDFGPVAHGVRGYAWDFPSLRHGAPWMNRGLGGSRWPAGTPLRGHFAGWLRRRGVDPKACRIQGWSAPVWHPRSPQGAPGVLLAGDAVGVDPWLGEGISSAIGSGMLAAHAAAEGLERGRLDFRDHHDRLRESAVGWQLERNARIADPFYALAARPGGLAAFRGQGAAA